MIHKNSLLLNFANKINLFITLNGIDCSLLSINLSIIINTIYNKNLFKKMKNQSYIHPVLLLQNRV
ncbi:hypothetical protein BTG57_15715 [Acinetobacter baumannii]|nr:hypothetical protein RR24_17355 [Acinetobacter baumannii]KII24683.1 hypothetical protein PK64_05690 [Acinetobacter baumannii]KJF03845.1 hypothetical protein RR21_03980 [Acinetobacter baumannii]KJF05138.1 hypothetical protein RR22_15160 [Acinetobacter baumannii]KQF55922.1 hypothetical protein APC15_15685 [Acinetobacter baumannii]